MALQKPGSGLRPIAVGSVFRRLAAKTACLCLGSELRLFFRPVQLGFGTSGGCEAAVHAAHQFLSSSTHSHPLVLLKVDSRNAFNSVRRDCFLHAVREKVSCLFPFVWLAYRTSAHLFFGDSIIPSATGVQQDDPLGPVLFSLAIHSLASELVSTVNVWYLDDGTLGSSPQSVLADFTTILEQSSFLGLSSNLSKCEAYIAGASSTPFVDKLQSVSAGVRLLDSSEVTLLGSLLLLMHYLQDLNPSLDVFRLLFHVWRLYLLMMPFICCVIVLPSPNFFISCALLYPGGFLDF